MPKSVWIGLALFFTFGLVMTVLGLGMSSPPPNMRPGLVGFVRTYWAILIVPIALATACFAMASIAN